MGAPAQNNPVQSNNPFDAFSAQPQPAQNTGFGSDPFAQNSGFGQNQFQANAGFGSGMGQTDWNAGFSNQFSGGSFPSGGAFDNDSKPKQKNSEFASLDPFANNKPKESKPAGGALPPGVNGFDLFD